VVINGATLSAEIPNFATTAATSNYLGVKTTGTGATMAAGIFMENSTAHGLLYKAATGYGTYKNITSNDLGFYNNNIGGNISILNDHTSGNINFAAGGSSTAHLTIASTGVVNVANLTTNGVVTATSGNGTLATVAPGTNGNVLTSNGTTWQSSAPTTGANPAGSGSELQFRSSGTAFGAVTSSSVSGGAITLGNTLTVTQGTANANVLQSTGYSLTGTNASSMIDLAGTWNTTGTPAAIKLDITDTASNASSLLMQLTVGGANRFRLFKDGGLFCAATVNGTTVNASNFFSGGDSGQFILGGSLDTRLQRDAAAVWAMRNGANAHTLRIYEMDSGANDEYLEISAASGTNLIRPQATGTGTASVVRYHTTTSVFWTSGSGTPEGVVTAPVGSLFTRTDGGAATTLYVKESGTGSTGWVAK
jgi:hypothetical protein